MSGEDVLQRMREFSWRSVIYLGDSDDPDYMARILEEGADRYFAKGPFNQELFVASAGAVIRRASIPTRNGQSDIFKNGGLAIDFRSREVTLEDREVPLTRTEYRLLTVLARNVGRIVTHDEILLQSWRGLGYRGDQFAYQTDDRHMLRVNICRVRGKLGENSQHPQYIINYPRVGYEMPRINNGDAQYQETL